MFENRSPISYCKLKDGKVEVYQGKNADGTKRVAYYDQLEANVTGLSLRESEYQGEQIKSWQIELHDAKGEVAILTLGYSSGFTRSFFNSLLSADFSSPIRISCYTKITDKGEWNAPSLAQGGNLLRWKYPDMPKTEKVKVGSKEVINDEEAVKWMLGLVEEIKAKIPTTPQAIAEVMGGSVMEPMPEEYPTDLPFDN